MLCTVQTMLEQGLYKPADVCRAEAAAKKQAKPTALHIKRVNKAGRPIKYEITDRLPADKSRWQRVVALFCQGKAWQFKQYPDEGDFKVRHSLWMMPEQRTSESMHAPGWQRLLELSDRENGATCPHSVFCGM